MLKKKLCVMFRDLQESLLKVVYDGREMEDCNPFYKYGLVQGATVHVIKIIQTKEQSLTEKDWYGLNSCALRFKQNPQFRNKMLNVTSRDELLNIILNVANLNENLSSITKLPHSELLDKLMDNDVLFRLAYHHPALVFNVLDRVNQAVGDITQVIILKIPEIYGMLIQIGMF